MKWKKAILWTFAVIVVLVGGLAILALLVVRQSPSVRRAILTKVERYANETTGAQVEIRDFQLHPFPISVQLEGIVVRGRGPESTPLLQIERVTAAVKVDSVLKRQWHLQNLAVYRPVAHVFVNREGESNLPQPQTSGGAGISKIFDLAIQKCLLDRGEIYFNDTRSRLEAEMYNLQLRAEFDRALTDYRGALSYEQGRIQYGNYGPVLHDLDARFTITPAKLTLDKLAVVAGRSRISASGTVENFGNTAVHAVYDAQLSAGDLAVLLKNPSLPDGTVRLTGSLTYQRRADRSFMQDAMLIGDLSSSVLQVRTAAGRADVRDLRAAYKLAGGDIEVQNVRAEVLGGSLNGNLTIRDLAGAPRARMKANLRDVSVERLEAATQQYLLPEAHLSGKISADTQATWGRTLADLVAHIDATLQGALGLKPSAPLNGLVHVDYTAHRNEVELRQSYLRTAATSLTLDGKISRYSQLRAVARSNNLHELELLAANLRTALSGEPPPKADLYGTASFNGSISGAVTEPELHGTLDASNLRMKGSSWKFLRVNVDAGPSALRLSDGHLEATSKGRIDFSLQAALDHWAYTPASDINLQVSASQIPVDEIGRLANRVYPVAGTLSGNVFVRGSQLNPVGHGELSLADGKVLSEPIQSLSLKFEGNGKAVQASLLARLPAGTARAEMTLEPKTKGYQAQIQADNIRLERLQAVKQRKLPIAGALNLNATGQGTLTSPELTATVKVSQLQIGDQTIQGMTLAASVRHQVAEIGLNSEFAQTPFTGHGTVEIKPPYMADLHLDTLRFSFQPLLALYAPAYEREVHGQTELHASLRGPLQNLALLEGHIDIPVLTASYHELQLGAGKPVHADYKNGVLALQPTSLQGTGTNIQMQATIPVSSPAKASYLVQGTVDLSLAQMLKADLQSHGQIQFDIDSRQQAAGSDPVGELRIVNASLHSVDLPLGLDNGNGVLTLSRTRLAVKNFQAQVGGGTVTARGGVTFRPAIQFDLGLSGNETRLHYPEGVRSVLASNLTLTGNKQEATLAGTVRIQGLSLSPDFDVAALANQFGQTPYARPSIGFEERVRLNVELQSTSQINVATSQVSLRGNANLRLAGTAAEPVVLGRANFNGGDLFLGGKRYVLQSGSIEFINPVQTEALVNAQLKTTVDQYDITIILQGPTDRLKTTYLSEPPLPTADVISLLAFGHRTEATGSSTATLGNLGPQSLVVQGLGSTVSSRVQKFAGLSYFSVDPTLGGSNQNAAARVVIQQRITSNLVVTYSTDLTSTQRQAVQLEYEFNPRWSVSGVRDQNGGFGATASYRKSF